MHTAIVETGLGSVEYSEAGSGEPVLYFHGTGITGDVMLNVEAALVDDGFRLIAPNRPGYGRTPLAPHRSAADCARLAAALLDTLRLDRVGVMGSSGGAAFAASFAVNFPSRAKSLILLCPQVHRWDHKRWLPATSRWTLPWLRRPLPRKVLLFFYRLAFRRMSPQAFLETEAGERHAEIAGDLAAQRLSEQALAAMRQGTKCAGFENDFVVFVHEEIVDAETPVRTPTLIVHDERDPIAPAEHAVWFASQCVNCERLSVHAAGHLIWIGRDAEAMHRQRVRFLQAHR